MPTEKAVRIAMFSATALNARDLWFIAHYQENPLPFVQIFLAQVVADVLAC